MITDIKVRGFKSLKAIELLNLGRLNLLVGANASGKSSLLQLLLLLRQSCGGSEQVKALQLSGDLFEGGTARDILHPEFNDGFFLSLKNDAGAPERLFGPSSPDTRTTDRRLVADAPLEIPSELADMSGSRFGFVGAERLGPRVSYKLRRDGEELPGIVGSHGEFVTGFLARSRESGRSLDDRWIESLQRASNAMPDDLQLDATSISSLRRLDLYVQKILQWIIPGFELDLTEHPSLDSAQLGFIRDPSSTRMTARATHVGFGLSHCLPVIAAAVAVERDGMYLLENPEAHLHPQSQSRLGRFLALAAACGPQMFIETHSDHVVNGVRLAVKYGLVAPNDVKIFYFSKNAASDDSSVEPLSIDSHGSISAWPSGFFDQIEKDLARL